MQSRNSRHADICMWMIGRGYMMRRVFSTAIDRLKKRGLVHSITLKETESLSKDASVYAGFDPTASSLHLGNLLALISLLHFSLDGHQTIALVGGATGRIGDPSWRSTAKERLAESTVETNIAGLKRQIGGFLEKAQDYLATLRPSTQRIKQPLIVDNYDWYRDMDLLRFLDQVGSKMRVASLISRDSVKSRMQSEQGLSYSELTYQLLQAYDFYYLHRQYNCRLQVGGSDQWGNIVSGLDLINKLSESKDEGNTTDLNAHGLTMPLLVTSSGEKMGKSAGNAKWLDPARTSPFELYQYFADMSDKDAVDYLPKMSFRRLADIEAIQQEHSERPEMRLAQRQLAFDVVSLVHSVGDAQKCQRATEILFSSKAVAPADLDVLHDALAGSHLSQMVRSGPSDAFVGTKIVDILADGSTSKNALKQTIRAGGVSLNGHKMTDILGTLTPDCFLLTPSGKSLCLVKSGRHTFTLLFITS